jgi:hypothetical protein
LEEWGYGGKKTRKGSMENSLTINQTANLFKVWLCGSKGSESFNMREDKQVFFLGSLDRKVRQVPIEYLFQRWLFRVTDRKDTWFPSGKEGLGDEIRHGKGTIQRNRHFLTFL